MNNIDFFLTEADLSVTWQFLVTIFEWLINLYACHTMVILDVHPHVELCSGPMPGFSQFELRRIRHTHTPLFWPGCNMIVARSQSIRNFNIFARSEFRSKPRTTLAVATISTFWENYAFTSIFLDASSMNREGSIFRMTWNDSSTILIPWTDS